MMHLFCVCGEKVLYTVSKPKFCTSCGASLSKPSYSLADKTKFSVEYEIKKDVPLGRGAVPCGTPSYANLKKLDCEIERDSMPKSTLESVLSNPMNPDLLEYKGQIKGHRTLTKEEYIKQSLSECSSSRRPEEVDE